MTDITTKFGTLYHPTSALVFYQTKGMNSDSYVEYFDMDKNGNPINAHPLTLREASQLSKALKTAKEIKEPGLKSEGIMSKTILHLDPIKNKVIWFTKSMQRELFFTEDLGISKGIAHLPAMLWIANKTSLTVFALGTNRRPTEQTILYNAPFFNVYENGNVCMGTVAIQIKNTVFVEEFTSAWENYFFKSYFSHLMPDYNPIKGNCVTLWGSLINTNKVFPKEVLKKSSQTLKNLL